MYHKEEISPQKRFPIIPIGIGIFLIGLAIILMASPKSQTNVDSLSSVIPAPVNYATSELSLENINGKTQSLTG